MARTFASASTDRIDLSVGTLTNSDGSMFAALVRRADASNYHGIFSIVNGSTQAVYSVEFDNTANGFYITDPSGDWNVSMSGATPATTWLLVVVTQQGGSGAYDVDVLNTSTGAWTNALSSSATPSGTAASARIGAWCANAGGGGGFNDYFNGQIAWLAYWGTIPSRFTSSTPRQHFFQAATLAQIAAYNPDAMWVLDQGATADSVRDLTGNGANQSALSGTTVSTVAAPTTSYGGHPMQVTVTAPAGGSVSVTPGVASLTLATFAPTVTATANQSVTPSTASLALTGFAPTVSTPVSVTPAAASLTLTGLAPTVTATANQSVTPAAASLTLTGLAPTVTAGGAVSVTPATATATLTGFAPTVTATANQSVTPSTASLTLTGYAPTVTATANQSVTPATATLTLTGLAPTVTVTSASTLTPGTASLALTGFAPTVTATANQSVTPGTASLTLTGYAPTVTTPVAVTPGVAALILTGYAPTVTATSGINVTPATAALTLTGYAPTVTASGQVLTGLRGTVTIKPALQGTVSMRPTLQGSVKVGG